MAIRQKQLLAKSIDFWEKTYVIVNCININIIEVNFFISRGYDFGKLETIASVFPSKLFIAVTATAPVPYQDAVL